jgi:TonB-linked SusC/RagA family outer membrane protein
MRKHRSERSPILLRAVLFFLLFVVPLQWSNAQITLSTKRTTLETVIKLIKEQSTYHFFYNDNLSKTAVGPINVKNASIQNTLNTLLDGKDINYKVVDKVIYLSKKEAANESTQAKDKKPHVITGKVTDAKGEPLIGVNVKVKGTSVGAITDINGNYRITTSEPSPIIVYSYVGYKTKESPQKGGEAKVVMQEESQVIGEIVVTALGIKRAQKALSYNVQQIGGDDLTLNKDANFINSLNGKVAGVTINASSSGVGGASKVVMRGSKSIMQSSNALYVIDGIPMTNMGGEGGTGSYSSKGVTEAIADINPEDIESMSVLTGAAAAALYGSSASNGAIVITTKKGKAGHTDITFTQNTDYSRAFRLPEFQNRYGTSNIEYSWGPLLNETNYRGYSPKSDYLRTGIVTTENVSLSTGSEKNQTYLSAGAVNSRGIVPNNKYNRYNFTFRNTTSFLHDKMTLDVGANYIKQNDCNMINQGTYTNPLLTAYLFPRGDDWNDIKMFERYDTERNIYVQYWPQQISEFAGDNPYWINYRDLNLNYKDRYMLNAGLTYKVTDWLSLAARIRVDNSTNKNEEKYNASTNTLHTEGSTFGFYGWYSDNDKQTYGDFIANINKTFLDNRLSLQANIGASLSNLQYEHKGITGPLRENLISNKFSIHQIDNTQMKEYEDGYHDQTKSLFGSLELGWESKVYLTLTGRNDWPSQLSGPNSNKKSFFYPSVGASFILSQIFQLPEQISFLKVRASYASVGLPFPRFIANPTYEWDSSTKQWSTKTVYPMYNLKPELTKSWEIGLTARFLKHFNLDMTLYSTKTYNQTFNPEISVSSAYSKLYVQTGSVRNQGIELALGYKNTWGDFSWASNYTFSANRNKILELVRNYVHPETGAIINMDRLDVGGLGQAHFILKEGGTLGDLYSLTDLQRDAEGHVYIDKEGKVYANNNVGDIKLGSVFPKSNMAWQNSFSWKGLNLSFMIAARFGGIVYSATQAVLDKYGVSENSAAARDLGYVLVNGQDRVDPQSWYSTVGNNFGIPQYYTYSATNIRLQEASLGYTFKKSQLWGVGDLTVSVVGRNLLLLYCKAPFDPETTASTGNYYQGIDNFMTPSTRNIGFNIKLKF